MSGSLSNVLWAYEQTCPSPLAKLLLLRIADGVGGGLRSVFVADWLAAFAGSSCQDTLNALLSLNESEQLIIFAIDKERSVDVALPWYREHHECADRIPQPRTRSTQYKPAVRRTLMDRQDGCCWYCGDDLIADAIVAPHVEHQMPLCRGGTDGIENLVMACAGCNIEKRRMTVEEYRLKLIETKVFDDGFLFWGERT